MNDDVERVVAAMAKAWDTVPDTGTLADMRHALAQAAMRETRLIDAEWLLANGGTITWAELQELFDEDLPAGPLFDVTPSPDRGNLFDRVLIDHPQKGQE